MIHCVAVYVAGKHPMIRWNLMIQHPTPTNNLL